MSRRQLDRRQIDRMISYASLAIRVALVGAILAGYALTIYSIRVCGEMSRSCQQFDLIVEKVDKVMARGMGGWE